MTSFKNDVLPLFTNDDITHMNDPSQGLDVKLDDYDWMSDPANAKSVCEMVKSGQMPIDDDGNPVRTWTPEMVATFESWMNGGYQP